MGVKSKEEVVELLNDKLKELLTYEDFVEFEKLMDFYSKDFLYAPGFMFFGKSNKYEVSCFDTLRRYSSRAYYNNRVDYFYSELVCTGSSEICKLYEVVEVKHRW